jgi:hypothetical protein
MLAYWFSLGFSAKVEGIRAAAAASTKTVDFILIGREGLLNCN